MGEGKRKRWPERKRRTIAGGQSVTGMEYSLGCCSLRPCNEMGVFLGCSLLRPRHRPIGGCCYLQLRDLPSPFRLQLKPWLGFASSHRTHVSSGKLGGSNGQRIVRDLRRSSARDHPDQPFHRETKFSPGTSDRPRRVISRRVIIRRYEIVRTDGEADIRSPNTRAFVIRAVIDSVVSSGN